MPKPNNNKKRKDGVIVSQEELIESFNELSEDFNTLAKSVRDRLDRIEREIGESTIIFNDIALEHTSEDGTAAEPFVPPDIVELWRDTPSGPIFAMYRGRQDKPNNLYVRVELTLDNSEEYSRLVRILDQFNYVDEETKKPKTCLRIKVEKGEGVERQAV